MSIKCKHVYIQSSYIASIFHSSVTNNRKRLTFLHFIKPIIILPLGLVKKDKVEGFKATEKVRNELRKDLFRTGKTKKDWLADSVDKLDNLHKVRNKPDEKWVAIPASELEHLHSGYPEHYHFIYDRILEHCVQQNLEITFDNLLLDCIYFYNYNIMKYNRYTDDGLIVLEIEHDVGLSYSEFTNKLIKKFIKKTKQYSLKTSHIGESTIIFKLKKLTS